MADADMIGTVAEALAGVTITDPDFDGLEREDWRKLAAAALKTIREHDEGESDACSELALLRTRIQKVLLLDTGQNRSMYGIDFEAGMVKALCIAHAILNPGSPNNDIHSKITEDEQ